MKDQTDFLAQIYDWQLKKAIFPIGHYEKNEVREIAEREHLINAKRKDSQGICFLGNIDYNEYCTPLPWRTGPEMSLNWRQERRSGSIKGYGSIR